MKYPHWPSWERVFCAGIATFAILLLISECLK